MDAFRLAEKAEKSEKVSSDKDRCNAVILRIRSFRFTGVWSTVYERCDFGVIIIDKPTGVGYIVIISYSVKNSLTVWFRCFGLKWNLANDHILCECRRQL